MKMLTFFLMFMISGTRGEFEIPRDCIPWIQECYPVMYRGPTAVLNLLLDPSSLVTNGKIHLDCSVVADAKVQHCVDTDNGICSVPIMASGLAAIRSYVCTHPIRFLMSAPCLTSKGFRSAWMGCLNGPVVAQDNNCAESRWNCVTTRLLTYDECTASDTELITGLIDILGDYIPAETLQDCQ